MEIKEIRIPSFGEQLIGINIDNENTDEVTKIKATVEDKLIETLKK